MKRAFMYGVEDIAREALLRERKAHSLRKGEFWALREINFSLQRGTSLGLLGANGSGKTTLLRMLSGLIKPTTGEIRVRGKIAPLLALGAGFNPVLSGRENIFVNLALLGIPRREAVKKFESIVDFADIGGALESPVKTYSSGMAARLGFACAIHTDPDLILVDEILAVGDMKFRTKCYRKLADMKENGTSLVLVSHNPLPIISNCQEALYLKNGELISFGPSKEVVDLYEHELLARGTAPSPDARPRTKSDSDLSIESVHFETRGNSRTNEVFSGEDTTIVVTCRSATAFDRLSVGVLVKDFSVGGENILQMESGKDGFFFSAPAGTFQFRVRWPKCGLRPGDYSLKTFILRGDQFFMLDCFESFMFMVRSAANMSGSYYYQPRGWEMITPTV